MSKKSDKKILHGATTLGIGALIAKILGAIYRIPLTNVLGSYGLGLYQMVFPVYTLLLDFSGAGVPSAISKIIASYKGLDKEKYAFNYLRSSIRLLLVFGLICTLIMLTFSKFLATLQGDKNATNGYLFLAPAVVIVSIICCYRGYFQGLMNMNPTAVSQVIEQGVKLVIGLMAVKLLMPNVSMAVGGATLAITISEGIALLFLVLKYRLRNKRLDLNFSFEKDEGKVRRKKIIKTVIPITLMGIALPLSHVLDSFLLVNILSTYNEKAISMFGIYSGAVHTVLNLPVALCYGVATVSVPIVAERIGGEEKLRAGKKSLLLTFIVAMVFALCCFLLSPLIIKILFGRFNAFESELAVGLLKVSAINIVFTSLVQTSNAILIGMGKLYSPVISLFLGVVIKTLISVVLTFNPSINIYGGAIGSIACYFFVCLVNLFIIFRFKVKNVNTKTCYRECTG